MKFKGARGFLALLILVFMMAAYYCYLSNRTVTETQEANAEISNVQAVLLRDLKHNYPATPKELVKYYSEITQCFYNETYTDEELRQMSDKVLELYDRQLADHKSADEYYADLKSDIADFKAKGVVISSFKVASSTDVSYFTKDGYDCAGLNCMYTIRTGTSLQATDEVFILRKDETGHWKIFGFQVVPQEQQG